LTQDDENSYPKIDHTKCLECGLCTTICPNNALKQNA
jgi:formate hydrogenlyase subunit 6/NADH:ubiquinone oxidoreductase subunit I